MKTEDIAIGITFVVLIVLLAVLFAPISYEEHAVNCETKNLTVKEYKDLYGLYTFEWSRLSSSLTQEEYEFFCEEQQ